MLLVAGCQKPMPTASVLCSPPECAYTTQLALVAEVAPLAGKAVQQEFTSLHIDEKTGRFTLTLAAPVTLRGAVTITGADGTIAGVAASVVATRPSRIAGRPALYYQAATDPADGSYSLPVSPNVAGESYTIRVTPNDPTQVPPMQETLTALTDQNVEFGFADPSQLPALVGSLRDSLQTPLANMQVQAIDPDSGATVSTTVTTDITGSFSLRLLPSRPATVQLVASPAPAQKGDTTTQPITLTRLITFTAAPMMGESMETSLQLPPLPAPAHITYVVSGTSPSGAPTPVVGATCVFSADVSDPTAADGTTATYVATTMTDASGNASVDLAPAAKGNRTYQVTIAPDVSSSFQARTTTVDVAPQGGFAQLKDLALRPQLSGRVLDPTGRPLANATIAPTVSTLATAGDPTNPAPTAATATAATPATTGPDGRFALRLDPATWDVGLIPPAGALLPRLWLVSTSVVTNTALPDVTVPRGVMVQGIVHDDKGAAVDADVRLYTVAAGNSANCGSQPDGCLAPARLRAEGPTDNAGTVTMILPSQPVD